MITVILSFFSAFVVLFLCFPIHECSHALVAHLLGDDTASEQGRVTLNPFAHLDPMGTLGILLCHIGWAKPVPVNLTRCRKVSMRKADILVSIAGPVSNLLMALLLIIVYKIIGVTAEFSATVFYLLTVLRMAAEINVYLAVFNMIPVPPFDGSSLLRGVLPIKQAIWMEEHAQVIHLVVFVLIMSGALRVPLGYASNGVMWVLDKVTWFIQ